MSKIHGEVIKKRTGLLFLGMISNVVQVEGLGKGTSSHPHSHSLNSSGNLFCLDLLKVK